MIAAHRLRRSGAALEGSLREMPLCDVLQLLDLGRKSVVLRMEDARAGRAATIVVRDGRLVAAGEHALHVALAPTSRERRTIVDVVWAVTAWAGGRFAASALPPSSSDEPRRGDGLAMDVVLLEVAHREDEWARVRDRIDGPHTVPRLATVVDGDALTLSPDEWRLIALVDGRDDLKALARRSNGDVLAIARDLHRLIGAGVLTCEPTGVGAVPNGAPQSSEE